MKNFLALLLAATSSFAATFEPATTNYRYQDSAEYQAILATLKTYGAFDEKVARDERSPAPKVMSKGERAVEEAKAKNRAILAELGQRKRAQAFAPDESELAKWKREEKETLEQWKNEERNTLKQWKREQDIFLGKIKVYQENTFAIPARTEMIVEKKIPPETIPEVHIVNGGFSIPIKDQANRPTCVAFAGARALETILRQNHKDLDLSEQYLYWAGKPKCQRAPCGEKGSWIREVFNHSRQSPREDIPTEDLCVYTSSPKDGNETQLPLGPGCLQGVVKVSEFVEVRTISDVVEKLKLNIPVVIAAKLSENFYKNAGLVTVTDALKPTGVKLDGHSLGHAFLAIGLMELPVSLKASEGAFCIVVANSWGKGWGAGGYSCVTEKWLEKYRQPSAFHAPVKLTLN